ncbi:myrosinase 1 isoform X2 [Leptinotarsa decemlineata]|uniref:myrosinase 1 isoform X2 n=1 Tax=Leptinotarsa decemlineata TaxID=7539 RepID=UPI003D306B57
MLPFLYFVLLLTVSSFGLAEKPQLSNKTFPKNFSFGATTSAYQIEGAWNLDGKSQSVWDNATHRIPGIIKDLSNADIACDSYLKYKEDVALLKALGVQHYRFSLAWTRILPTGFADEVNEIGVNHYKNLIRELKNNQIQPMVTLYHQDLPQVLMDRGGTLNPLFPKWFEDYARVCFESFGDDVKHWFTINEPYIDCTVGFISGGLREGIDNYICAKHHLMAHAAAWHLYDNEFRARQGGKIALVLNSDWMEPASHSAEDVTAAATRMQFIWGWFGHPIYYGDWPDIMKTRIAMRSKLEGFNESRLPELTQEEIAYIKGTNDFFAVNTYTTTIVQAIEEPEISSPSLDKDIGVNAYQCSDCIASPSMSWLKFVPWGTRKLLKWFKDEYFNPDILITENGWADGTGQLDDDVRENYIKEYLSNIRDAMEKDGVKVIGYTLWSLLDNFEWASGFTAKFGTIQVDFSSPNRTRTRKKSSFYYERVCRTHCLVGTCEE